MPSALSLGVTSTTHAAIQITDFEDGESLKKAQATDEDGKVTDEAGVSRTRKVVIKGFHKTAGTPPHAGEILTVDSGTVLIDDVKKTEKGGEYRQLEITGSKADDATLTAYDEPTT
jgi:hypothetical protein